MITGIGMMAAMGLAYLLGFAMSFDAPGSDTDPLAWLMRILIFMPIVILLVVLIFALRAFMARRYRQSMWIASIFPVSGIGLMIYMSLMSTNFMSAYTAEREREAEEARLYPKQKFFRPVEGGADSIIVFSTTIPAFAPSSIPRWCPTSVCRCSKSCSTAWCG
jgi:hypothetical protein